MEAAELRADWYSAMVSESSLSMSNRHTGKPRLSLRPDQCGYSKESAVLSSWTREVCHSQALWPSQIPQLQCYHKLAVAELRHAFGRLQCSVETLSQHRTCRHAKTAWETCQSRIRNSFLEGSYGSRGIQNCCIIVHSVRHIDFIQADGFFLKQAAISTSFPEFLIGQCFRLIQVVWWQALEALIIHCKDE